jgi:hypothetical protein
VSLLATAASVIAVAVLMRSHMPFRPGRAAAGPEERRDGRWQLVYILGAGCSCSTQVAEHLAKRQKLAGLEEKVVTVGETGGAVRQLARLGWDVHPKSAEEVRYLYGARAAPLLVVIDPDGQIRYAGGLARSSGAREGYQEVWIARRIQTGRAIPALPAFGCALQFGNAAGGIDPTAER